MRALTWAALPAMLLWSCMLPAAGAAPPAKPATTAPAKAFPRSTETAPPAKPTTTAPAKASPQAAEAGPPASTRTAAPATGDATPLPARPLTLRECVETGLAGHPSLRRQASVVRQGVARTREVLAAQDLKASVGGTYQVNQPEVFVELPLPGRTVASAAPITPLTQYGVTLTLNKLITNFGLLRDSAALTALQTDSYRLNLMLMRRDLVQAISSSYLQILRTGRLKKLAEETLRGWEEHRERAESRYKHGAVARYDVLQAEVEVAKARDQLVSSCRYADASRANLRNLLALRPDDDLQVVGGDADQVLDPEAFIPRDLACARRTALDRRVEILVTTNLERQGQKSLDVARQMNNPTLSANVSYTEKTATVFFPDWGFQAGLALNIPLFTGRDRPARMEQAREMVRQAGLARDEQVLRISLEVENAWLAFQEASRRRETVGVQIARAEEGLRVARLRYTEGLSTGLEQVDAHTALTAARTTYENVRYDYLEAALNLEKAMGYLENGALPSTALTTPPGPAPGRTPTVAPGKSPVPHTPPPGPTPGGTHTVAPGRSPLPETPPPGPTPGGTLRRGQ